MLTPMLVQYIVGLCCIRNNPDAVEIMVGDAVFDAAAEKRRDVDVTVTLKELDGHISAFKAYEVKHEGKPLDVANIEQLCSKLADMPSITDRYIVSTSSYTEAAVKKAIARGVTLLRLQPWTRPLSEQFPSFPGIGRPDNFFPAAVGTLLYWVDYSVELMVPSAPNNFHWKDETPLFTKRGKRHSRFKNAGHLANGILLRSTEALFNKNPAQMILRVFPKTPMVDNPLRTATPPWPHTHTLQLTQDEVYLQFGDLFYQIDSCIISGSLQWQTQTRVPNFFIIESVGDGTVFSGVALAELAKDGLMFAMIFGTDGRSVDLRMFRLNDGQRNFINKMKLR